MSSPGVVFGLASYNHADQVREAIESILGQRSADFAVVVVDDRSTDGTYEILQEYAGRDPRVVCLQNERRVGMIENWRRAFFAAVERHPGARYFAWVSDHDVWHPQWLATLSAALNSNPTVVLAYPLNTKLFPDGSAVERDPWYFETFGDTRPFRRLRRAAWSMSAGNMVYGLFRIDALRKAGVFRRMLVPDRMLLAELALAGEFRQIRRVLWFRRWYGRIFSLSRQRLSFFPDGKPLYAYVPWWISHGLAMTWNVGVKHRAAPAVSGGAGILIGLWYFGFSAVLHVVQTWRAIRLWVFGYVPSLRGVLRRSTRGARHVAKAAGLGMVRNRVRKLWRKSRRLAEEAVRRPGVVALRGVRTLPLMQSKVIPWLVRQEIDQIPGARAAATLRTALESVAAHDGPIVVGPWLSEVGFEVLYWIPFLNWATRQFNLTPDRLIAVSRGGVAPWYRNLCGGYVDLFELMSVDEYRRGNTDRWQEAGNQKQHEVTPFERSIADRAAERLNLSNATLLHPSLMYQLFRYYWYEKGAISVLRQHTEYRRLPSLEASEPLPGLPADYVAMRFYFRPSFPDTVENRRFVQRTIAEVSRRMPVVLLNTNLNLDDHADFAPETTTPAIYRVDHLLKPENNLEIQSRVIARARAFVGTYGGLAYLGPFYGVPAVGVYSDATHIVATHLDVTHRLARMLGAPLTALGTAEAGLVALLHGGDASTLFGPRTVSSVPAGKRATA